MKESKNCSKYDIRMVMELTTCVLERELVVNILPYCWTIVGQCSPHDEDLEIISRIIAQDLQDNLNDFRKMYIEEVKKALWDGSKGYFGPIYGGMSIKNLESMLIAYRESSRGERFHKIVDEEASKFGPKRLAKTIKKTVSQEETDTFCRKAVESIVKDIERGEPFSRVFNLYNKKIPFDKAIDITAFTIPYAYVEYSRAHAMPEYATTIEVYIQNHIKQTNHEKK